MSEKLVEQATDRSLELNPHKYIEFKLYTKYLQSSYTQRLLRITAFLYYRNILLGQHLQKRNL